MNRYERAARIALAKRLRSMVPDPNEFEGFDTEPEQKIAADYFVGQTTKLADKIMKGV